MNCGLTVHMTWPMASFNTALQKQFIEELALHAGISQSSVKEVHFEDGCTIFKGIIEKQGALFIKELFDIFCSSRKITPVPEIFAFFGMFQVTAIRIDPFDTGGNKNAEEPIPPGSPVLVFLHGWRGDELSFGDMPKFLQASTKLPYRIFNYPTGVFTKSPSIYFVARALDNWIRNLEHDGPIVFLSHSLGGLVTRKFLVSQSFREKPLDVMTKLIFFIASPMTGTNWAEIGKCVPLLRKAQISDLAPSSPALVELSENWSGWVRLNVPKNCRFSCIYGTDDAVVSPVSAAAFDPEAIPIVGRGHIDIVKPEHPKETIVVTTTRIIKEAGLSK